MPQLLPALSDGFNWNAFAAVKGGGEMAKMFSPPHVALFRILSIWKSKILIIFQLIFYEFRNSAKRVLFFGDAFQNASSSASVDFESEMALRTPEGNNLIYILIRIEFNLMKKNIEDGWREGYNI
jgi:hypothetical protein